MVDNRYFDVIDEGENIIGRELRSDVHKKGLLHREIHVWIVLKGGQLVFQKRGANVDTFPNLLDASVGGHVDSGENVESAVMHEILEETGLSVRYQDLRLITKTRGSFSDEKTQTTNNVIRYVFLLEFPGLLSDLKSEQGKSEGFEAYPIDDIIGKTVDSAKFVPSIFDEERLSIFQKIKDTTKS